MRAIEMTAFDMAQRFVGVREVPGSQSNPAVLAMLKLDDDWPEDDDVPWCSAFANYVTWLLRLPRSKSLMARSWLKVGRAVNEEAEVGFDMVILKRGGGSQPGPEVTDATGHVGFYAGMENGKVLVLGGNQGDEVNITAYPRSRVLGIRRLY
ncbi:TIGR02594 family protein [Pseudodesulfovibrio karagichevae]|uniref:TIGR02594 family protein n=1 Tax=Pseudodesulfovibrio karagichevae TaxID=3239305 RepID=A0ABV4K7A6_9BACT